MKINFSINIVEKPLKNIKTNIALVADVIDSKNIKDRKAFEKKLQKALNKINKENKNILSPYTITLGDEIQAVFGRGDSIFKDSVTILEAIYPEKMRFSYGIGNLIKPINPKMAIGMDGPAFYSARKGIDSLKKNTAIRKLRPKDSLYFVDGENIVNLNLMNETLTLVSQNMMKWNDTKFKVLAKLLRNEPMKKIADDLGFSEQNIYKTNQEAGLKIIISIFSEVEKNINEGVLKK